MYLCMRNLLALVLTMLATNPFSISMLLLCVHNLLFPLSILLMCPRIFLNFVILVLIWAVRITWLICLEGVKPDFSKLEWRTQDDNFMHSWAFCIVFTDLIFQISQFVLYNLTSFISFWFNYDIVDIFIYLLKIIFRRKDLRLMCFTKLWVSCGIILYLNSIFQFILA